MINKNDYKIRWPVMIGPALIFMFLMIFGSSNSEKFVGSMWAIFEKLMVNLGWLVNLVSLGIMIFLAVIFVSPVGKIKFGGKNAVPKYSKWNWWAISLCAGISTGTLFWGASEPLIHASKPAMELGLQSGSTEAIMWSMGTTFLHWTIVPYAIIVGPGIVLAYAYYNLRKPYGISSGLVFQFGDKALGKGASSIVDGINAFAITGGVAGALGYGMLQIGSGMSQIFGIETGPSVWISIAVVIIICYCISSMSGLDKGIKWLSDKNAWIFLIMLAFGLIFGPTSYILNMTTQAFGEFIHNIIPRMTFTSPVVTGDLWPQWWTMYYLIDWMAFGPISALFLMQLCYGRTIREFITVNLVFPAVFGIIWFGVFGGIALNLQYVQGVDLLSYLGEFGAESMLIRVFDFLPLAQFWKPCILIVVGLSFITLADSMTSTTSLMSIETKSRRKEAPMKIKLFWGLLMGGTSLIFVINGGLDGVKVIKSLAGFPIIIFPILMIGGFIKYINKCKREGIDMNEVRIEGIVQDINDTEMEIGAESE